MHERPDEGLLTISRSLPESCVDEIIHAIRLGQDVCLMCAEPIMNRNDDKNARDPARDLCSLVRLASHVSFRAMDTYNRCYQ